jgi:anti-anti-sigma regulatory factor/anti-sigma regulatory factor (Ser/Thr protein kinase)
VSLTAAVTVEPADGIIVVALRGLLTVETVPAVRATLLKCLVQAPDAVIVDLADLRVDSRSRLTVFPAALRTHALPGTTLVVCGAPRELAPAMTAGVLGDVRSFASCADARASIGDGRPAASRRASLRLEPTPAAPARARRMITEVLRTWGIDDLAGPATLIVSELVSNAVQHAGTALTVDASLRREHLYLSVRDHEPQPPTMPRPPPADGPLTAGGRGLHLIEVYATAWGSDSAADGKTVWATLRVPGNEPPESSGR